MHEPPRPEPAPTFAERVHASITFLGPGRLLSGGLSILLVAAGCWWLLRAPAPPVEARLPLTAGAATESSTSPAAASSTTTATSIGPPGAVVSDTIVVQAAGAVAAPGVYSLPAGARVHELISAAGGVTAEGDPAAISLAVVLVDGQRVYVPLIGEIVPTGAGADGGGRGRGGGGHRPDRPEPGDGGAARCAARRRTCYCGRDRRPPRSATDRSPASRACSTCAASVRRSSTAFETW